MGVRSTIWLSAGFWPQENRKPDTMRLKIDNLIIYVGLKKYLDTCWFLFLFENMFKLLHLLLPLFPTRYYPSPYGTIGLRCNVGYLLPLSIWFQ
jgi:hypothetical protein